MIGRFITLEGGEGVGKSTQLAALRDALARRGLDCVTTREPGGTAGAEAVRSLLLNHQNQECWGARAEAMLFAAARSDHVERLILPALNAGQWVLCDRFVDSNRAYQAATGQMDDAQIMALHQHGSNGLMPDRTFLLQLPMGAGLARAGARDARQSDAIGGRDIAYHERVAENFNRIAQNEPARVRAIDASGTAANVTARLLDQLSDLLP